MIHEILPVGPLQCNCSVIGDEATHEAMVIDPGDDIEDVLALIRKHNLQVKQIVITHAHIDHVGGAMKLRAATGAPILLNQNDYALLKMLDVQAAWIGMARSRQGGNRSELGQADTVRPRFADGKRDAYSRPHRRQRLPVFSRGEEADRRRHAVCGQHWPHRSARADRSRKSSTPCTRKCWLCRMTR